MSSISRRRFLGWIGALGAGSVLPRQLLAGRDDLICVSILHTTDLHGHILPTVSYEGEQDVGGFARCATQIRKWKEENPNWVLLDAGDVYQGTEVGLRTRGGIMAKCFNALGYDGWSIGNHEFDWGMEPLGEVLKATQMPGLSANAILEGKPAGQFRDSSSPLSRVKPWILKQVGGIKIGIIGLTTPGLPNWFHPSFTQGFEAAEPSQAARRAADELREAGADAIVLLPHMGERPRGDDPGNRLIAVSGMVPEAALIIGGHTHRDTPASLVGGLPYTQAAYHGLNVGRADLFFDPNTKKLVRLDTITKRMTSEVTLDPGVMSLAQKDLEDSAAALATPAGTLNETFSAAQSRIRPSDTQRLIAAAIFEGMAKRRKPVDAVLHGSFSRQDLPAGPKTVGDLWEVIPYENFVIIGELTPAEILVVLEESLASSRNLMGIRPVFAEGGSPPAVAALEDAEGKPLDSGRRYRVAMNTYDAASGGGRLLRLREIMQSKDVNASIEHLQTREALVDFLSARGERGVGLRDLV